MSNDERVQLDAIHERHAYVARLRSRINKPVGMGKHKRPPTTAERLLRAAELYRHNGPPPGVPADEDWSVEDYVHHLTEHYFRE